MFSPSQPGKVALSTEYKNSEVAHIYYHQLIYSSLHSSHARLVGRLVFDDQIAARQRIQDACPTQFRKRKLEQRRFRGSRESWGSLRAILGSGDLSGSWIEFRRARVSGEQRSQERIKRMGVLVFFFIKSSNFAPAQPILSRTFPHPPTLQHTAALDSRSEARYVRSQGLGLGI